MTQSVGPNRIFPALRQLLLAVCSGVLLALSYPNFSYNLLGWICFVPLLRAIDSSYSYRQAYLSGLTTGVSGIGIGFYWVSEWAMSAMEVPFPFSILFVIGFAFCFGQMFGLIAILFCWLRRNSGFDEIVIFPVSLVTVFSLFPLLFAFRLGDSQWRFLTAIQPIDIAGIAGLDYVMSLANVLVFKLMFRPGKTTSQTPVVIALIALIVWFAVGWYKLQQWDRDIAGWSRKKIGIVQPNRKATLVRPIPEPGFSRAYPLEMELSSDLIALEVDLLVWPEGHFFGFTFWENVATSFGQTIAQWNTPLVFYDPTRRMVDQKEQTFNTILFLNEKGDLVETYDKVKLVPFSEYMPVLHDSSLLDWILGDYLDNLTPGTGSKIIHLAGMRLVPKTCYEPLFPRFVGDSVGKDGSGKVVLVQSQDGWFGETSQPFQHMAVTVMRAVENRVPLIHVIQNGPSGTIHPQGRFAFMSDPFVRGSWVAEMAFDPQKGGSFYSRNPNLFITIVRLFCLLLILKSIYDTRFRGGERRSNAISGSDS